MSGFAQFHSFDELAGIPFPDFQGGFTPWEDFPELNFADSQQELLLNNNDDNTPVIFSSVSDNSNLTGSRSGSEEPSRCETVNDERKRRRMQSNRESARRSRMRKQKHLESLDTQLNRLKIENRALVNRLHTVTYNCQVVQGENVRLRNEMNILHENLNSMRRNLLFRQLQQQISCNNFISIDGQYNPVQIIT